MQQYADLLKLLLKGGTVIVECPIVYLGDMVIDMHNQPI